MRFRHTFPAATDLRALERDAVEQALQEARGDKALAARRLGITRTQLYVRVRRHGIADREG